MEHSKIEWTQHTFNPWRGCTKISAGCKHCYAEAMSGRNPAVLGEWGDNGTRVPAAESYWRQPLRWDRDAREALAAGRITRRPRVFCASLADVFEEREELKPWRLRLLALIALTPHLDWLLLTKRPEHMARTFNSRALYQQVLDAARGWRDINPDLTSIAISDPARGWHNLWVGTSVEDQTAADARIPWLLQVPAAQHFLSMEPLLGPVDIQRWLQDDRGHCMSCGTPAPAEGVMYRLFTEYDALGPRRACEGCGARAWDGPVSWVIVGGESGPRARPMHPEWARGLREQCSAAGAPFFFKQWGEWVARSHTTSRRNWHAERVPDTLDDQRWRVPASLVDSRWGTIDIAGPWHEYATPFGGYDDDGAGEAVMLRVGKKAAGRLLDGVLHDALPAMEGGL